MYVLVDERETGTNIEDIIIISSAFKSPSLDIDLPQVLPLIPPCLVLFGASGASVGVRRLVNEGGIQMNKEEH